MTDFSSGGRPVPSISVPPRTASTFSFMSRHTSSDRPGPGPYRVMLPANVLQASSGIDRGP
jgi:hypothetical protein